MKTMIVYNGKERTVHRPERRAAPRLHVLDQLHGQLVSVAVRLTVRDIGPGGFSVDSSLPFPLGARHLSRFTTADGVQVVIEAAVMHTRPDGLGGDLGRYVQGFPSFPTPFTTPRPTSAS